MIPKLIDVQIKDELLDGSPGISVVPVWSNVDRPTSHSWGFFDTPARRKLTERFKRAMLAGVVFRNPRISTDIYGKTYAEYECTVWAKQLNADLKRLGF